MKRFLYSLFFSLSFICASAQSYTVSGTVNDASSREPIELATIQLLRNDSTMVTGDNTDANGAFKLATKKSGNYIVKISYVSYLPQFFNITFSKDKKSIDLGKIALKSNDVALNQALVTKVAKRVEQVDDTTMYNAAAYRVPEGSTLDALVKRLPGVEVADDGKIKWNGKEVKEFLVNGKDFFKGETDMAMKNLPADLVSRLKAYDKKSDYTELTGIDDGEETTVLDIMTKRALNEAWITNIDGGYGTHDRYSGNIFAMRNTDKSRITATGSLKNTDRGSGLTTTQNAGLDIRWENGRKKKEGNKVEVGGSINWTHRDNNRLSTSASETFLTGNSASSFSNSASSSGNESTNINTNFRFRWDPDSMTRINLRPNFSFSKSNNFSDSRTATFNDDPYFDETLESPLDSVFAGDSIRENIYNNLYDILVNANRRQAMGESKNINTGASLNLVRNIGTKGRNVSLDASINYSKAESESFSKSDIRYFQNTNPGISRPDQRLNQYTNSPSMNWNYRVGMSYSEPLTKYWHLQFRYNYSYRYNDSERELYDLGEIYNNYMIGYLDTTIMKQAVLDAENSQYATYKYFTHNANIGIRYNTKEIKFNAGVNFDPEKTKMDYKREGQGIDTVITRHTFNVSPQVRLRYNFSKTNRLEVFFNGRSSQPSMTNLLDVVNNSDPLNISMGNPGLKPSWNNSARITYNGFNPEKEQGIMGSFNYSQTLNSIDNLMIYDEATGVRYTRPENINGKWNMNGNFTFNTPIDKQKRLSITTHTNVSFDNSVGYVSSYSSTSIGNTENMTSASDYNAIFKNANAKKNTTKTLGLGEMLNMNYRVEWFDIGASGNMNYRHSRNQLQQNGNMDTWDFSYGANANFNFTWGMSISTDIRMSSRRGYAASTMNTNELIWNAQLSQRFLNNKATLSLRFYDILQEQSNVSRTINAMMRSDSWNNSINSYCMLHFTYRLNVFKGAKGGKGDKKDGNKKDGARPRPNFHPGMMPMGGWGGGHRW